MVASLDTGEVNKMSNEEKFGVKCPIPGCQKVFDKGIRGYYTHVGSLANHPDFYPEITDPDGRRDVFIDEFPGFLGDPESRILVPRMVTVPRMVAVRRPKSVRPPNGSDSSHLVRCPLRGCTHAYVKGISGWEEHIGKWDNHPTYHPEIGSETLRTAVFRTEFAGWFVQATDE